MKALILVGGFGTRLRPLTFFKPKPLVDFANQPMIFHQIRALAMVGVTDIVLAVNYQPQTMADAMKTVEEEFKIKIHFSQETEPLGTAGPLALAKDILGADNDPFFVLNSDVICEFPFQKLLDFHREHGCEGTLMTTVVDDPTKYGVICYKEGTTRVDRFVEKPKVFCGDQINAGIYIFNPSMLNRIELRPTSIEKEIFPAMAKDGQIHAMPLPGFWADVGQPRDFLTGTALYLESLNKQADSMLAPAAENIVGNVMIHSSATIGAGCKIGPNVVIGPNVIVEEGVRLHNAVVMEKAVIRQNAFVKDSIVGWYSTVGRWSRLDQITVLGEDVHISDEILVNGACVLPHKSVSVHIMEPRIVM